MDRNESADTTSVLGFAGSLREGSCNRALLRTAVGLAPPSTGTVTGGTNSG